MPTASELKERIESALPGAQASVEDLNGGGDHFRAEVVSDRFDGLSRIDQHKLVYDVFGNEIGGAVHPPSLHTSPPGRGPQTPPPTPRLPGCQRTPPPRTGGGSL